MKNSGISKDSELIQELTVLASIIDQIDVMEALLRQSRSMCPFLNRTPPKTLRSLSTATRCISPGGGTISNLQVIARRCPVMGKAMAVQIAKTGPPGLGGLFGGKRHYGGKAKLHTTRPEHATVRIEPLKHLDDGMLT